MKIIKNIKIKPLNRIPALMLRIGMPVMTAVFSYIVWYIAKTPDSDVAWAFYTVSSMLEYAMMSLTLIVCGALVADMALKE